MSYSARTKFVVGFAAAALVAVAGAGMRAQGGQATGAQRYPIYPTPGRTYPSSVIANPYKIVENWPHYGKIKPGGAIGVVPDEKGGVYILHRAEPPIIYFNAAGDIVRTFGDGLFIFAHGMCKDRDGNLWAGDSGPFGDDPKAAGKGFVFYKFSPEGKLLLTVGKLGVSKAGTDTFIMPTACVSMPNGNIMIADGHIPRPSTTQQDGDRILEITRDGKFVQQWGKKGVLPGEFWGPHGVAYDSQGRLFVADRSNNRVQIFDKNMNFLDEWRHFSRPSGLWITKKDMLVVSDSESDPKGFWPAEDKRPPATRNSGWQNGIRVGNAKDGSLQYFIPGTYPEGLGVDEMGTIFGGVTTGLPEAVGITKFVRSTK